MKTHDEGIERVAQLLEANARGMLNAALLMEDQLRRLPYGMQRQTMLTKVYILRENANALQVTCITIRALKEA